MHRREKVGALVQFREPIANKVKDFESNSLKVVLGQVALFEVLQEETIKEINTKQTQKRTLTKMSDIKVDSESKGVIIYFRPTFVSYTFIS